MTHKKIVLVSGNFNILHPGHIRLLKFAKDQGSKLVVAVISDKQAGSAAHVPQDLRLDGVRNNVLVDEAFIADEPIEKLIEKIKPDIVVKGKEHEALMNPEAKILETYGGELVFSSGEAIFSTVDLIQKEFNELSIPAFTLPAPYMQRHGITKERLSEIIKKFTTLNICVVGDLIVDEYITCDPLGMSQEDPTIVVTPVDSQKYIGGASIVAGHASGLGANVLFLSVSGADENKSFAEKKLFEMDIEAVIYEDETRPTTLKQRYRCKEKSLLRVSHLHEGAISQSIQEKIYSRLIGHKNLIDLLVFSDFNYGALPQPLVEKMINFGRANNIFMAADSQSSSQIGNIGRFKGLNLLTPTEREARISTRNREDGLVVLASALKNESMAENILLKLGGEGVLVHSEGEAGIFLTDRVDALNTRPKDVAGAGDSLLISSAMARVCGASIWEAALIGSIAAALQVGRVGNIPLSSNEILSKL